MRLWRNPELVRHARVNLRPVRLVTAAGATLAVVSLVALAIWVGHWEPMRAFQLFFLWMTGFQLVTVIVGCGYCCGQSVVQERLLNTFDFLRTTRMSAWELASGMALGAPSHVYFVVGCLAICAMPAALFAGIGVGALLGVYMLVLLTALISSVTGLWVSMLGDRSAGAGAVVLIFFVVAVSSVISSSPFPGMAAISPIPALTELLPEFSYPMERASLFGAPVSYLFMTILLYALFGSWMVLMIVRNLKRDRSEMQLLTGRQALGFTTFLNVLFYGLLARNPRIDPVDIVTAAMVLNALILFAVGLAMANPREKLKLWWRARQAGTESYLSESGFSWPWMVAAAGIALALFAAASSVLLNVSVDGEAHLRQGAIQLGVFLLFIVRDVSFLQICTLTRMKRPFLGGFLYLTLYYAAALVIMASSPDAAKFLTALLTPYAAFAPGWPWDESGLFAGAMTQTAVAAFIFRQLHARLARVAALPAARS